MTDPSVVDLYPDFVCFWRFDLYIFNGKVFPGFPSNCGLFGVILGLSTHASES